MGLSPGEAATRVPGTPTPEGRPTTVPLGVVTPPEISRLPPMGTGRARDAVPDPLRNPNYTPPPAALPGQMTTGLSPTEAASQQATGSSASAGFQRITDEGTRAVQQDALLANMQNDLARFSTGTGAQKVLQMARFGESFGVPLGRMFGIKPETIAAQESFDKLANQLADAQGAGSDARLHVNMGANPNSGLSPEGADFIIRQLRGNADYLKARQALAAKWTKPDDLRGFEAKMTESGLDPRVFQFNRLTPEQKHNYFYGIKDERERKQFMQRYELASKSGLLALPDAR